MKPFHWEIMPKAETQVQVAMSWLETVSEEAPQRFYTAFVSSLSDLCLSLDEGLRPQLNEAATLYHSRPVFELLVYTGKRIRRSNSGVWRVFYDIVDKNNDGMPDTVRIVMVRHAAAKPLSIEEDDFR